MKFKKLLSKALLLSAIGILAVWGILAIASPFMLILIIILLRTPCR